MNLAKLLTATSLLLALSLPAHADRVKFEAATGQRYATFSAGMIFNAATQGNDAALVVVTTTHKLYQPISATVTSVTYAGLPLTRACSDINDGGNESTVWVLVGAPRGTFQVHVQASAADDFLEASALSYSGVRQLAGTSNVGTGAGLAEFSPSVLVSEKGQWLVFGGTAGNAFPLTEWSGTAIRSQPTLPYGQFTMDSGAAVKKLGEASLSVSSTPQSFFGCVALLSPRNP